MMKIWMVRYIHDCCNFLSLSLSRPPSPPPSLSEDVNGREEVGDEEDWHSESESVGSLAGDNEGAPQDEVGLIDSRDDIPEEEFLKMISDDITTGSHDSPVRSHVLTEELRDLRMGSRDDRNLVALILTPTRELALQVTRHICDAARYTGIQVYCV